MRNICGERRNTRGRGFDAFLRISFPFLLRIQDRVWSMARIDSNSWLVEARKPMGIPGENIGKDRCVPWIIGIDKYGVVEENLHMEIWDRTRGGFDGILFRSMGAIVAKAEDIVLGVMAI